MKNNFRKRRWLFIPIFFVAVFLFGAIVMGLWNAILPAVVGVRTISFWQALGILLLSKILFGGFHGGGWRRHGRARWMEMQQKLASMSPEEKEKFQAEWKNRCSGWRREPGNSNAIV